MLNMNMHVFYLLWLFKPMNSSWVLYIAAFSDLAEIMKSNMALNNTEPTKLFSDRSFLYSFFLPSQHLNFRCCLPQPSIGLGRAFC